MKYYNMQDVHQRLDILLGTIALLQLNDPMIKPTPITFNPSKPLTIGIIKNAYKTSRTTPDYDGKTASMPPTQSFQYTNSVLSRTGNRSAPSLTLNLQNKPKNKIHD